MFGIDGLQNLRQAPVAKLIYGLIFKQNLHKSFKTLFKAIALPYKIMSTEKMWQESKINLFSIWKGKFWLIWHEECIILPKNYTMSQISSLFFTNFYLSAYNLSEDLSSFIW